MKLKNLLEKYQEKTDENAVAGSTAAGAIASIPKSLFPKKVIRRVPKKKKSEQKSKKDK